MSELPPAIQSPADVDAWASYVRERVTPALAGESRVYGPDWVIHQLDEAAAAAGRMVLIVKEADALRGAASRALARAVAAARMQVRDEAQASKLTVDERAARVEQLTVEEADAAAVADRAYEYAKAVARLVEGRKSGVQTIGRMVEITYSLAGSRRAG